MAYARMIVAVLVFPAESAAFVRNDTKPLAGWSHVVVGRQRAVGVRVKSERRVGARARPGERIGGARRTV
jgi:hypothetical protein